jgi:hypothetical protein
MNPLVVTTIVLLTACVTGCGDRPTTTPEVATTATPPAGVTPTPPSSRSSTSSELSVPATPTAPDGAGWSPGSHGLRGRLVVTQMPGEPGQPQIRLDLELENVSDSAMPIEIWWESFADMLELTLEDEAGVALPREMIGGNYLSPPPHWLAIPHGAAIRLRISRNVYEYVRPGRTLIRPFSLQAWVSPAAPAGTLYLRGTLTAKATGETGHRAWTGPLALPRVALPRGD